MGSMPVELGVLIGQRYGLHGTAIQVAAGVSGSRLWRIESPQPVVVRVSAYYDLQHMVQVCRGVTRLGRELPKVIAPLAADDGEVAFLWDDRPVSVWPFVSGVPLDRHDSRQLCQAAQLLARLHQVKAGADPTDHGDDIPGADNAAAAAALLPDADLDRWLDRWRDRNLEHDPPGWRHGDYFWQNILCRDGTLVGLIDWDDLSVGSTMVELASATWEFGKSARGDHLVPHLAAAFLDAYRQAGGRSTPLQDLVPLIRESLRRDVAFFRRIATSQDACS